MPLIAGVSAATAEQAGAYAEHAADAGAVALMCLPPLGYRGDERRARGLLRGRRRRHRAAAHALQQPRGRGRRHAGGARSPGSPSASSRSSRSRSARATCAASRRCCTPRELEVLVGGDDWALEGFCAGATGWVTGVADVAPAECVALYDHCRAGELEAAREVYRRLLPLARFDMTPKLVQYFKAAMDEVGFAGGPTRAPRLRAHRRTSARRSRDALAVARRGGRRLRAARYLAAVDSHTEGMPTRVITGGVGPLPGATMLERKLRFEAERDDLRLLLMREPRGHAAMSGAILQPPTRDDADWGVLYIEVSGCLPMCGHGTIGVATVLVETGMVEVREPETVVRLDTPAGLVEARVAVAGRAGRGGDDPQRAGLPARARPGRRRRRAGRRALRHGLRRQLLRARRGRRRWASTSTRPARPTSSSSARGSAPPSPSRSTPSTSASPAATTSSSTRPGATARTRATPPPSIRAGSTARRAGPGRARAWPRCTRAASSRWARTSSTSRSSAPASPGRLVEEVEVGGVPAVVPEVTGRAWITGMGQYLLDERDPFPAGFAL